MYELVSAEDRASRHPGFEIPPRGERASLEVGDFVKLIFAASGGVERMWVEVEFVYADRYEGRLRNRPLASELPALGATVTFHAQHVASIIRRAERKKPESAEA